MTAPTPAGMAVTRPTLEQELARFREALDMVPDVADRHAKGEKFNAYDLDHDEDRKAICIGPITSRPLSLIDSPSDVAGLLEAALRVASTALAAEPTGGDA